MGPKQKRKSVASYTPPAKKAATEQPANVINLGDYETDESKLEATKNETEKQPIKRRTRLKPVVNMIEERPTVLPEKIPKSKKNVTEIPDEAFPADLQVMLNNMMDESEEEDEEEVKPKRGRPRKHPKPAKTTTSKKTAKVKSPTKPKKKTSYTLEEFFDITKEQWEKAGIKKGGATSQFVAMEYYMKKKPQFTIISADDAVHFYPEVKQSPKFTVNKDTNEHSLELFSTLKVAAQKGASPIIIHVGGKVQCLQWLQNRSSKSVDQFVAIGVDQESHPLHFIGQPFQTENIIQIWRLKNFYTSWNEPKDVVPTAKFVLGICHEYGCPFDLQWCPNTSTWELENAKDFQKSLGLLSACFGDGGLRFFNVPHPSLFEEEPIFLSIVPSLTIKFNEANITHARWSYTESSTKLICGDSSGFVAHYQFSHNCNDQKAKIEQVPLFHIRAHANEIRDLAWNPDSPYLFISASFRGPVKIWDTRNPIIPVSEESYLHKNLCLSYWKLPPATLIVGTSEGATKFQLGISTLCRVFYTHTCPIWHLSVSSYLSHLASCGDDGCVKVGILLKYRAKQKKKSLPNAVLAKLSIVNDVLNFNFRSKPESLNKNSAGEVTSFPNTSIGWYTCEWSPNVNSCNWLMCGANIGVVCCIPFDAKIPK